MGMHPTTGQVIDFAERRREREERERRRRIAAFDRELRRRLDLYLDGRAERPEAALDEPAR